MAWVPCSGREHAAGVVWLRRMLQKARRCEALGRGRLAEGYCFGNNDFIDKQLIAFLGTADTAVSALVREHSSDDDVAAILVAQSGRSPQECAAFNTAIRRRNFDFILLEADEGRLGNGFKAKSLKFIYNAFLMRVFYPLFQRDERRRLTSGTP